MWQDDYAFADQPGKQLTRLSRTQYRAELNMVKGRPTRHFGIRGSTDPAKDPKRNRIVIKGKTTGTEDIDVQFRFTLEETSGTREIFRGEVHQVPLGGPCGELRDFEVTLEVPDGIPARSDSPPFFTFQSAGDYRIIGELIRPDGTPTALEVTVEGKVVETQPIEIHLVPVVISDATAKMPEPLKKFTEELADYSQKRIPDYFPLAPGGIRVVAHPRVHDARAFVADKWFRETTEWALRARLTDLMRTVAQLSLANRMVAVLYPDDFTNL